MTIDKVDMNQLRATIQSSVGSGVKVDFATRTELSRLLSNYSGRVGNDTPAKNVISNEDYKYKDMDGKLIKYDDGTCEFQTVQKQNGKDVYVTFMFNKEQDVEKQQPAKSITASDASGKNRTEIDYEYHRNGKVKHATTRNADGVLLREVDYNKKGKKENEKIYDTDGSLKYETKFKYLDNHQVESKRYDKDGNLLFSQITQCDDADKNPVWSKSTYPNGNTKSEIHYNAQGKMSDKTEYYENGQKKTEVQCWDNGNAKTVTEYYENGNIKAEMEVWDNSVIKSKIEYDEQGNAKTKISPEIDGNFGESRQVGEGDCYLMATINSIRELNNGQQMLNDLVQVNTDPTTGKKTYTVTFPGAKIAADGLRSDDRVDPNKMYITGTYTFTEEELESILKQAGTKYSIGDADVILLEAAFEKYREEVSQTMKANNLKIESDMAGLQTGTDPNNILSGGRTTDATFILTGKPSKLYDNTKDVAYGLDVEELMQGNIVVQNRPQMHQGMIKAAVPELDGPATQEQEDLDRMLDEVMHDMADGNDLIATASFVTIRDDGKPGGHALTIKAVTADSVVLVNPWHPDKEVTMSREEFKRVASKMTICDPEKEGSPAPEPNPTPSVDPTPSVNPTPSVDPTPSVAPTPSSEPAPENTHKVIGGDNFWNIARDDLKEKLGRKPTNAEIAKHTKAIISANGYKLLSNGHTNPVLRIGVVLTIPDFEQ